MLSAIVCVNSNWGIGYKGELLYSFKEDMDFFKSMTLPSSRFEPAKTVIMGRKTADSLPNGFLKDRKNIIISNDPERKTDLYALDRAIVIPGSQIIVTPHISRIMYQYDGEEGTKPDAFVIGGASIYEEFLPECKYVYLTYVNDDTTEADTFLKLPNDVKYILKGTCLRGDFLDRKSGKTYEVVTLKLLNPRKKNPIDISYGNSIYDEVVKHKTLYEHIQNFIGLPTSSN